MTRPDLRERKAALRRELRAWRDALSPDERERMGRAIEDRLMSLPEVAAARTVMAFASFGSEVPTGGIVRRLLEQGCRVLLPYLDGPHLHAAELRPGQPTVRSPYGPGEPPDRTPADPSGVDVVVAPGLGFDRNGHRLGYGGGHYDRFLAALRPATVRIGIAFASQVVAEIPHGPLDEPLDLVVTDRETIVTGARALPSDRTGHLPRPGR
jgi:5-formyltetrahydrofolate cyclo-ligase